ncbi:TIGR02594 family protein [Sphingomonas laterariae]|uniref:TIGR02594 family protein n=1 Tax=Edaphosphingomonas laterariae TaxID=861865 RepID=A0A239E3U3_9SPHN|nr:TIGR02594 family protein [Sphingomonas laterariae]SNS38554.1 TIGR02594 family protein [Sphingomonas laterariae]
MTQAVHLPQPYRFLETTAPLPRMVQEAIGLFGTREQPGPGNNPVIMQWVAELGDPQVKAVYTADAVPWCGLFMAIVARRAAKVPVRQPLWALNWGKFGVEAGQPMLGDVLTFVRPEGGHVALYIGESSRSYHVLGGNQADRVCFAEIAKTRLRAARRPLYVNRPATVKPYLLGSNGAFSTNEA